VAAVEKELETGQQHGRVVGLAHGVAVLVEHGAGDALDLLDNR
jgi:hypothetical protein